MRVDLNAGNAIPENTVQTSSPAHPQDTSAVAAPDEDSQFSSGEAGVSTLASVALHAPEVRKAKVEELRAQIASGNYHISSNQLASSILDQLRTSRANRS